MKIKLLHKICTALVMLILFNELLLAVEKDRLPFRFEVIKGTREVVMTQEKPWEEQMMAYYKVLRIDKNHWEMWYSTFDNKRKDDYSNYLTYAWSKDGKHWIKEIPGRDDNNILRGSGHPNRDGLVEQDVFIDESAPLKYKMIYTARDLSDNGREKTFIEESADGINWLNKRVLWNSKHDSQFSVIQRNNLYYIYLRNWEVRNGIRYRTIGLAITDKNWNILREPVSILKADFDSNFPHLYNPAASKISNSLDVLFPTCFNQNNDSIKVCVAFRHKEEAVLTGIDLTQYLFEGEQVKWGIVMPGLVHAGKDTYWLYYYGSNMAHSQYLNKNKIFKYYRIKVKISLSSYHTKKPPHS